MCRGWTLNTQLRIQPRKGRRAEREKRRAEREGKEGQKGRKEGQKGGKRRAEVEEGRGKGRAVQGIGPL